VAETIAACVRVGAKWWDKAPRAGVYWFLLVAVHRGEPPSVLVHTSGVESQGRILPVVQANL